MTTNEPMLFNPSRFNVADSLRAEYEAVAGEIGRQWLRIVDDKNLSEFGRNAKMEGIRQAALGMLDAADQRAARQMEALRDAASVWTNRRAEEAATSATITAAERDRIAFALSHSDEPHRGEAVFDMWRACASRRIGAEVAAWVETLAIICRHQCVNHPVIGKTSDATVSALLHSEVPALARTLETRVEIAARQAAEYLIREGDRYQMVLASRPAPLDMMHDAVRRRARGDAANAMIDQITRRSEQAAKDAVTQ